MGSKYFLRGIDKYYSAYNFIIGGAYLSLSYIITFILFNIIGYLKPDFKDSCNDYLFYFIPPFEKTDTDNHKKLYKFISFNVIVTVICIIFFNLPR
mgnify:CR=1 FL=1|tara:strand:- start:486 stop:773 length:288 start_codon:yes stop_codon:yes gene_type:complete